MSLKPARDAGLAAAAAAGALRLLGVRSRTGEFEVVYGQTPSGPGQIAVLTRSMLGVLGQITAQTEVPPRAIASGRTVLTMGHSATERRAIVTIRSGLSRPDDVFVAAEYDKTWFWIDNDDFGSKLAFTVVNIMLAAAKSISAPGAIVTIPAG